MPKTDAELLGFMIDEARTYFARPGGEWDHFVWTMDREEYNAVRDLLARAARLEEENAALKAKLEMIRDMEEGGGP